VLGGGVVYRVPLLVWARGAAPRRVGGVGPSRNWNKRPGDVAAMFDAIAGRYDLLNDLLSMGQVPALAANPLARITGAPPGGACARPWRAGTGNLLADLHRHRRRLRGLPTSRWACSRRANPGWDVSQGASGARATEPFVAGDALRLPFRDGAFDAVDDSRSGPAECGRPGSAGLARDAPG